MKMQAIHDLALELKPLLPLMKIYGDDNIMSSVAIHGSFDAPETWTNQIFHNSRYFSIHITPMNKNRWYAETDPNVTVEMISSYQVGKFRKYTGTPDKVIAKIQKWIQDNQDSTVSK